ncbi:hypothetical protein [Dyadobacter chenhuakuii]|uniref:Uncharacterized protein n=1 Tax=Dyadobacter chenhuakuii TaxID=2909339 RepID=A0A9X1TTI2_9BACT|nr:hypothetical protein [Dyadobacter chenhuakuii]MCF2498022.1 hypothetical protein [Dyadobacter chenhuakuii]
MTLLTLNSNQFVYMGLWKAAFFTLSVVLVMIVIMSAYLIIGQSYSLAYMRDSRLGFKSDLLMLSEIMNSKDQSESGIVKILENRKIVNKQNCETDTVQLRQIILIFKSEQFHKVVPFSD